MTARMRAAALGALALASACVTPYSMPAADGSPDPAPQSPDTGGRPPAAPTAPPIADGSAEGQPSPRADAGSVTPVDARPPAPDAAPAAPDAALAPCTPPNPMNLIVNGGFDRDFGSWTTGDPVTVLAWQKDDPQCTDSGSMTIRNTSSDTRAKASAIQCVEVTAGTTYSFGVTIRPPDGTPPPVAYVLLEWYVNPHCIGGQLLAESGGQVMAPSRWQSLGAMVLAPTSTLSAALRVIVASPATEVAVDRAFVVPGSGAF
jgi:hypothetical protein